MSRRWKRNVRIPLGSDGTSTGRGQRSLVGTIRFVIEQIHGSSNVVYGRRDAGKITPWAPTRFQFEIDVILDDLHGANANAS